MAGFERPLFLGEMLALSKSLGRLPVDMDFWKIFCRIGAMLVEQCFRTFADMPSGPQALCGLRSDSSFSIPSDVISIFPISGILLLRRSGKMF